MFGQQLIYLEKEGRNWIATQRDTYRVKGHLLESGMRRIIEPFFQSETLDIARICEVSQIANPPFYKELEKQGMPMPLDFHRMDGITFIDTILIVISKIGTGNRNSLVFHECVHIAQYLFLGVDRFAHEYVVGWANNGFTYSKIPLEVQAYELQERFDSDPQNMFSVETEIAKKWGNT